jgi:hypothetical protein
MSTPLEDGSILPTSFHPIPLNNSAVFNDAILRLGTISAIYLPNDPANQSKLFTEYDVLVEYVNTLGYYSRVLYPRCHQMSLFGGSADFSTFTLRKSTISNEEPFGKDLGSSVLVLCFNGDRRQGIIIGGLNNPNITKNPLFAQTSGHNYRWYFNGVAMNVANDGSFTLTFQGPTDDLGNPINSDLGLSFLQLAGDGNIGIQSNDGAYLVCKNDGSIKMQGNGNGNTEGSDDENLTLQEKSQPGTGSYIEIDGNDDSYIDIKPISGLNIGEATDSMLLGESFRNAQSNLDENIVQQLTEAVGQLIAASGALTSAGTSMLIPIAGPIIASPQVIAAAAAVASVATALTQVAEAITQFEYTTYLSQRNRSD